MKNFSKAQIIKIALPLYICFVFIQSLYFKFTNSPETQHIFGTLDSWAAGLGFPGLFVPPGIFNAYVIGSAELVASILLILSLLLKNDILKILGAILSMGIISGAIFFHLFTPLGIAVQGDGGILFFMACGIWISSAILLFMHKDVILKLLSRK